MAFFNLHSRPDFALSDDRLNFFSDPCSETDLSRSIFDRNVTVNQPFPDEQLCSIDQIVPPVVSSYSSEPSHQFGGLFISQKSRGLTTDEVAQYRLLTNHLNQSTKPYDITRFLGMKMVDLELIKPFSYLPEFGSGEDYNNAFEITTQNMQGRKRNYGIQSSDHQNYGISVDNFTKTPNFIQNQLGISPGNNSLYHSMKRFYELMNPVPNLLMAETSSTGQTSASDESSMAETSAPMVPYTPEQRKQSIDRYRAKRSLRNFNKTIKYVCRKTLADSRPRVRGRFTRNNECNETPNAAYGDQFWGGLLHGGGFHGTLMMGGGGSHF